MGPLGPWAGGRGGPGGAGSGGGRWSCRWKYTEPRDCATTADNEIDALVVRSFFFHSLGTITNIAPPPLNYIRTA